MRTLVWSVLTTVLVAVLFTILVCAADSMAQEGEEEITKDLEVREAQAAVEAAQARLDSVLAAQSLEKVMASVDTLYPALLAQGVEVSVSEGDPLYVEVSIPFSSFTAREQLTWREARVALRESSIPVYPVHGKEWAWMIHRGNASNALGVLDSVIFPREVSE